MGYASAMAGKNKDHDSASLLDSVRKLTGQVAGGTLGLARNTAAMTAMFGENWLRSAVLNQLEPERLEAMAEAVNTVMIPILFSFVFNILSSRYAPN